MHMNTIIPRGQKRMSDFLELEMQGIVNSLSRVLELTSSPPQGELELSATEPPPSP